MNAPTRLVPAVLLTLIVPLLAGAGDPLHFGVVSFYNPHLMYLKYQPLVDYLSEKTGKRWELAISTSYEDAVRELCAGRTAVSYLGPFTYLRAHEVCGALPVVRLQTRGSPTYRSLILVREDSPIHGLPELAGTRFGFGAPLSTSAHLVPRAMLLDAGVTPGVDVECRYYWHHERAAKAVIAGEVEACGVRDLPGERFLKRGLRVLARSEPIPNFPLAVGPLSPPGIREALVQALVVLPAEHGAARAVVEGWDEELAGGFAVGAHHEFAVIGQLAARLFGPAWSTIGEKDLQCGPGDR